MNINAVFINIQSPAARVKAVEWSAFLEKNNFEFGVIDKIDMAKECPQVFDKAGNKFCIDFVTDKQNYAKKKLNIKTELLSKALGAGKYGFKVLDLSAGLGIDAVFLAQLGYSVTAIERNPLIYLCLKEALMHKKDLNLNFKFDSAIEYLKKNDSKIDVIYFDPMFPEKSKTALSRQEMMFFKKLVGTDADAQITLEFALKISDVKRVVVKRPIKAPALLKTSTFVQGKLVRFDFYQAALRADK